MTRSRNRLKSSSSTVSATNLAHTCATLLLGRGVHVKLVQEFLGHSTISVTLDTYSHVLPGISDAAVEAMDEVLG